MEKKEATDCCDLWGWARLVSVDDRRELDALEDTVEAAEVISARSLSSSSNRLTPTWSEKDGGV